MIKDADEIKSLLNRSLLSWYSRHRRVLPWRETKDPYRIWISEIMLQQTRVDTVIPYYRRFLKAFPDVFALSRATLQEVLKVWENLGYYSRARNIFAASLVIVHQFDGRIPDTAETIKTLPGIGNYTAGAILSIAFNKAVPAVDGNVRRILCRVFAIRKPMDNPEEQKKLFDLAASIIPARNPGDFNQALMDLGATICRAKKPACDACPLSSICRARLGDLQNILPVPRKTSAIPRRIAGAAVIRNSRGLLLVVQRPATGLLASLWKLPGSFFKDGANMKNALRRMVKEESGLVIRAGEQLASVDHIYTHFRATLHAFECRIMKGEPKALSCQNWRWASPADLRKLPMSKIDRMILKAVSPDEK